MERRKYNTPLLVLAVMLGPWCLHGHVQAENVPEKGPVADPPPIGLAVTEQTKGSPDTLPDAMPPPASLKNGVDASTTVVDLDPSPEALSRAHAVPTFEHTGTPPSAAATDLTAPPVPSEQPSLTKEEFFHAFGPNHALRHYSWLTPPPPDIAREKVNRSSANRHADRAKNNGHAMRRARSYATNQRIYWQYCARCHQALPHVAIRALLQHRPEFSPLPPPPWVFHRPMPRMEPSHRGVRPSEPQKRTVAPNAPPLQNRWTRGRNPRW